MSSVAHSTCSAEKSSTAEVRPQGCTTHFVSGGLMKIARTIGLVMLIVAMVSSMGFAKAHKSAITNSKHDMRTAYGGLSFTLCNFCHVAHKPGATVSAPASTGALLWNHTLSNVTSYGVYSSDTFNGYNTDIQDLGAGNTGTLTVS